MLSRAPEARPLLRVLGELITILNRSGRLRKGLCSAIRTSRALDRAAHQFDVRLRVTLSIRDVRVYIWDRWPQFFRGRFRVQYEVTGEVPYLARPPLTFYCRWRRARLWRQCERPALAVRPRCIPKRSLNASTFRVRSPSRSLRRKI